MHVQAYVQGFARPLLGTLLPRSYQSVILDVTCYSTVQNSLFHQPNTTTWYTAIPYLSKVIFLSLILQFTWSLPFRQFSWNFTSISNLIQATPCPVDLTLLAE
jgi:hypothetical protein